MDYLLAFGGKDLSCYFNEDGCPKTRIHPSSGLPVPLFPPIEDLAESQRLRTMKKIWSKDPVYHVGQVTRQERPLRIINTLTGITRLIKVCDEDSINTIKEKYAKAYNFHAGSYIWRKDYKNVCFSRQQCEAMSASLFLINALVLLFISRELFLVA